MKDNFFIWKNRPSRVFNRSPEKASWDLANKGKIYGLETLKKFWQIIKKLLTVPKNT
jgi:hypothetical protein